MKAVLCFQDDILDSELSRWEEAHIAESRKTKRQTFATDPYIRAAVPTHEGGPIT
jgi:hypothetical protein